jgi:hypothetical protein
VLIFSQKIGVSTQNKAKLCNSFIITFVLEKKSQFFAKNCLKIAENCGHSIEPWTRLYRLVFFNIAKAHFPDHFWPLEKRG